MRTSPIQNKQDLHTSGCERKWRHSSSAKFGNEFRAFFVCSVRVYHSWQASFYIRAKISNERSTWKSFPSMLFSFVTNACMLASSGLKHGYPFEQPQAQSPFLPFSVFVPFPMVHVWSRTIFRSRAFVCRLENCLNVHAEKATCISRHAVLCTINVRFSSLMHILVIALLVLTLHAIDKTKLMPDMFQFRILCVNCAKKSWSGNFAMTCRY